MNYKTFLKIIQDQELFSKKLVQLITGERNQTIEVNRKYFEGEHWQIDSDGRSNTTTSGKQIWSKKKIKANPEDPFVRSANSQEVSFHRGQLQTKNFVKLFIHIYQEYINGKDDEVANVRYVVDGKVGDEAINEVLGEMWDNIEIFTKTEVARLVTETVGIGSVVDGISAEDAKEIFPIYDGDELKIVMRAYMVDEVEAKALGYDKEEDKVPYAEVYSLEDGRVSLQVYLAGKLIEDHTPYLVGEEEIRVLDELPFFIVANIDHPFQRFDCKHLEDSEIFDWIDQNDSYNASRTVEFLTNLFLASPKVSVNLEVLKELGMDLSDPGLQEAIRNFQYSPYSVDTLPIEVKPGNTIPPSFYTGLESTESGLYESASIPKFIIKGELPSGLATETVQLGMMILTKKISQKREQLKYLIQELSRLELKVRGYDTEALLEQGDIVVDMPDISGLTLSELLVMLREYTTSGILPTEYTAKEALTAIGRAEDVEEVEVLRREAANVTLQQVNDFRKRSVSEKEAQQQLKDNENRRALLQETNAQIEALNS